MRNVITGRLGITTDSPAARTPTIGVAYIGAAYSLREQLAELTVVELQERIGDERSAEDIAAEVVNDFPGLRDSFLRIFQGWVAEGIRIARGEATR